MFIMSRLYVDIIIKIPGCIRLSFCIQSAKKTEWEGLVLVQASFDFPTPFLLKIRNFYCNAWLCRQMIKIFQNIGNNLTVDTVWHPRKPEDSIFNFETTK
jgi:hypothetical protein